MPAGVGKIRLGPGILILTLSKSASRTGDFNSYSKERRSPGWGLKDPSRTMIYSYSKERRSLGSERSVLDHDIFLL